MQTLVKNRKIGVGGYMFIADKTGMVIAHPQDEHIIGQSFETLGQDLTELLTIIDTPLEKTINGVPYIF
ncbi:cache domain-containing protein [Treponema vincentii]|uniref:cache domain-containing protein n=1 Tax=Treponema vincentii TaxID=69710 RepID=UPI003D92E994